MPSDFPLTSTCSVCNNRIDYGERFAVAMSFPLGVENTETFQNIVVASPNLPKREIAVHASCLSALYANYGTLPEITRARTDTYVCPNCKHTINPGDRVFLNLISLGRSSYDLTGDTLEIGLEFEYIHVDCKNPGLYPSPKRKADPTDLAPHLVDRDTRCTRCRRAFEKNDKIVPVMIAKGKMYDPLNPVIPGLELMENFELMHASCENPQLAMRALNDKKESRFPGDIQSFHRP